MQTGFAAFFGILFHDTLKGDPLSRGEIAVDTRLNVIKLIEVQKNS